MSIVLLFAVAATGLIEPDIAALFTNNDYPMTALQADESAAAYVDLRIAENGRVTQCNMISYVGAPRLAAQVCSIIRRKTIKPARFSDGAPAPAALRTLIRLWLADSHGPETVRNAAQPPDIELAVKGLPDGAKVLDTTVAMAVGTSGETLDCKPAGYAKNLGLTKVACASIKAMTMAPLIDKNGRPVAYVTILKVRFTAS